MTVLIIFIGSTLLISSTGVAYAGILTRPGNLLDWLPAKVEKIKYPYIRDLFSCGKCISGQVALWSFIGVIVYFELYHWFFTPLAAIIWVSWIITVTDQAMTRLGYS